MINHHQTVGDNYPVFSQGMGGHSSVTIEMSPCPRRTAQAKAVQVEVPDDEQICGRGWARAGLQLSNTLHQLTGEFDCKF